MSEWAKTLYKWFGIKITPEHIDEYWSRDVTEEMLLNELLGEERHFVENFESIPFEDMTDQQKQEAKQLLKQEYLAGAEMSYRVSIDPELN